MVFDQRQLGSAAVEFALTVPLMLLVLGGSINVGRALMTRFQLDNATAAAARACVAIIEDTEPPEPPNTACALQVLKARLPSGSSGCAAAPSVTSWPVELSAGDPQHPSTMLFNVQAECAVPVLFFPGTFVLPIQIQAHSAMPYKAIGS